MITAVILSKDKACQLHLLLESIQKNAPNLFDIRVLYEASNAVYEEGYTKAKTHFANKNRSGVNFPIRWYERQSENLSQDIIQILPDHRDLTCVFNDENIIIERICSFKKIIQLFRTNHVTALSLRLGNNTIIQNPYSYNEYFINKPSEGNFVLDKFMLWDATLVKPYTNFAIPLSHNGHIFTTKLINFVLERTKIESISDFEKNLQDNLYMGAFEGMIPPTMGCMEYSACITNVASKISDVESSDFGATDFGLNDRYLNGFLIDYDFFDFTHISKPYQEFITRLKDETYLYHGN